MATRYRFSENYIPHFVTFSTVQWIDALSRPMYKNILIDSLKYCIDNKGLKIHAWVIMNNHIHLVISSEENKLEDIIRDMKKFTAKQIINAIESNIQESRKNWMLWLFSSAGSSNSNNKTYQFWQQDNHPIALTDAIIMKQKIDYIHDNPVRASIVFEPQHYVYSSAIDYLGKTKGLLPIELLL